MKRTHLSLYYLFAYLIVAGVALILAPNWPSSCSYQTVITGTSSPASSESSC